ncbi:pyridoxamine 5'-phosphate oxidase family protein [Nocardioides sp.]|uniref:pyridoxamine 5'-phosphate oxidase family protein n=1 Tax=Nocardioides sp. TaxID=35761 RepID=UPI002BBC2F13|nr:pyridoxamine 5'-phosphate oxidase family protein [Nocardioides sp.]HVX53544.1 pyridoxamine 5'-phosphate oxidase family protein [Nocardioides sp.]
MEDASTGVLDEEECWDFLGKEEFGRLAFRMTDELHIVPINYAVESRTLLFRTAPGDKLLAIAMGGEVAFETDRIEAERATSVVVRGHARILPEDEAHRAELVALRPWVGSHKYEVVEITPEHVSGRSYHLDRPWLHLLRAD